MRLGKYLICLSALGWSALSIVAAPCNIPPTATADAVVVEVGRPLIVDVLATASDPDGQALTVAILSDTCPAQVSAVVDPTQTLTVSAGAVASPCQITYRVSDGAGGVATTTLDVSTVLADDIFSDGFELGTTAAWSLSEP